MVKSSSSSSSDALSTFDIETSSEVSSAESVDKSFVFLAAEVSHSFKFQIFHLIKKVILQNLLIVAIKALKAKYKQRSFIISDRLCRF